MLHDQVRTGDPATFSFPHTWQAQVPFFSRFAETEVEVGVEATFSLGGARPHTTHNATPASLPFPHIGQFHGNSGASALLPLLDNALPLCPRARSAKLGSPIPSTSDGTPRGGGTTDTDDGPCDTSASWSKPAPKKRLLLYPSSSTPPPPPLRTPPRTSSSSSLSS
jgi:hypothetical protein